MHVTDLWCKGLTSELMVTCRLESPLILMIGLHLRTSRLVPDLWRYVLQLKLKKLKRIKDLDYFYHFMTNKV